MSFYTYILYSEKLDGYYIGYTSLFPEERLRMHLISKRGHTSKAKDWNIAGLYYRHKESIIPVAGFVAKRLEFTFSYDVTTSSLSSFNNGRGAFEFSLIKKGEYSNSDSKTLCPKF